MFQLKTSGTTAIGGTGNLIYVNIFDAYQNKDNIQYKPIITLTSQMTGKSKSFLSNEYIYTNKERYVSLKILVITSGTENLASGLVLLGNKDLPYGFYNVNIRENTSALLPGDAADINSKHLVYTGLANLSCRETGSQANPAVTYTEYSTNDSDTESVYITN